MPTELLKYPAPFMAHWPGKDTPCCLEHLEKLVGLAAVLGIQLSWTPCIIAEQCINCINEEK